MNPQAQSEMNLGDVDMDDALAHSAARVPDDKWPIRLAEIVDGLVVLFARMGRDEQAAINEAQTVAKWLANNQGGRPLYLPRGDSLDLALRNRAIYIRHRGNMGEQLADEYGLTLRQIQAIVAEQHALQVRKRQGNLFQREEGEGK